MLCNDSKMAKLNLEALYWIYDNKEIIQWKLKKERAV